MEVEDSKTTGDDAIEKKEKDIEVLEAVDKETKNVLSEKETISASDAHGSMSSSLVMSWDDDVSIVWLLFYFFECCLIS